MDKNKVHYINTNVHMSNKTKKDKYSLEFEKDKIVVMAPLCVKQDDGTEKIESHKFEFNNGPKADFIQTFFFHKAQHISIEDENYDLDYYLFGCNEIPQEYACKSVSRKNTFGYLPFPEIKNVKKHNQEEYDDVLIEGIFDLSKLLPESEFIFIEAN